MNEIEAKEEARERKGDLLNSVTITEGSAAKGISIGIKAYYGLNTTDDEIEKMLNRQLKIREFFKLKKIIL